MVISRICVGDNGGGSLVLCCSCGVNDFVSGDGEAVYGKGDSTGSLIKCIDRRGVVDGVAIVIVEFLGMHLSLVF